MDWRFYVVFGERSCCSSSNPLTNLPFVPFVEKGRFVAATHLSWRRTGRLLLPRGQTSTACLWNCSSFLRIQRPDPSKFNWNKSESWSEHSRNGLVVTVSTSGCCFQSTVYADASACVAAAFLLPPYTTSPDAFFLLELRTRFIGTTYLLTVWTGRQQV
jgi:hypothetical protein